MQLVTEVVACCAEFESPTVNHLDKDSQVCSSPPVRQQNAKLAKARDAKLRILASFLTPHRVKSGARSPSS